MDINDVYGCLRCLEDSLKEEQFDFCKASCDTKDFCAKLLKLLQEFRCEKGEREKRDR